MLNNSRIRRERPLKVLALDNFVSDDEENQAEARKLAQSLVGAAWHAERGKFGKYSYGVANADDDLEHPQRRQLFLFELYHRLVA